MHLALITANKPGLVCVRERADGGMAKILSRADQNLGELPRNFEPADVKRDLALHHDLLPCCPGCNGCRTGWKPSRFSPAAMPSRACSPFAVF